MTTRRDWLRHTAMAATAAWTTRLANSAHGAKAIRDPIKVGQIGTRHAHAGGKLQTMRKMSRDFEVVGVVEPDRERRSALESDPIYRGVTWMTESQLLNTTDLKAVAVETEVRDLLSTASRCVAAGVHVHLDKPAGESLEEFEKLLSEATRRKLTIQMGYMFRYNPAFQFLYQALRDGWLGDLFEVHAVMSKAVDLATRRDLARYRGGSMFELGCHLIDAVVRTLGPPERVVAFPRRTREDDLLDNQLAVFEYPRATATVRSALVEVEGGQRRQFVVCGAAGTLEIKPLEPPRLTLTLDRPRGQFRAGVQTVVLPELAGRYDGDFEDLARILREEKSPDYPPAHDLAVQRAVLEASRYP